MRRAKRLVVSVMEWFIAVVLVVAAVGVWRMTPSVHANEAGADPMVGEECPLGP